ncbi:MAG: prepilin peptidase [Candidatus Nomurabacteria bacterium]|nr:prepilin peptidase [Candidatus Nomurabacteria bacterium]
MTLIITIVFFVFGLIIGSFLNVVIFRLNSGRSFGGRSGCMTCNKQLTWYELIPVGSFISQKGKCRGCKTRISIQYPLVEILTGFIFSAIFLKFQYIFWTSTLDFSLALVFYSSIFSLLLVISVYDIKHKIIPDILSLVVGIISFIGIFFFSYGIFNPHIPNLYTILAGPILALPFATIWLISSGRWMGLGDAKLALGLGWLLGISLGFSALILAFWIGAIVGILLLVFSGKHSTKTEIPFAPFLVIGTFLIFLFEINFFPFY